MAEVTIFAAPELSDPDPGADEWDREREAFRTLLPSLMATYRGCYVAIRHGQVVADGPSKVDVARRAYGCVGYVPLYVGFVSERPEPHARRGLRACHAAT